MRMNLLQMDRYRPRSRGTTLLEVLIALLVLMMGYLAVAGLQSVALANNHSAFLRSQAVIQAHDMSDRMYANTAGVQAGAYNSISGTPNNPPMCLTNVAPGHGSLATLSCTPAQMAAFDAAEWNTANANLLPSGTGTVAGPDGNGVYTITLTWLEQEADGTASKSFAFQVQPLP
jgi:type IV pilus assembly protein PilV